MEIKLFGKNLFSWNKGDYSMQPIGAFIKESKYLPDFYKAGRNDNERIEAFSGLLTLQEVSNTATGTPAVPVKKVEEKKEEKEHLTPKNVFELKMLHEAGYVLNVDPKYVDEQLAMFKDKLGLIKSEEWDVRRGVEELSSIVVRLENRKSYEKHKEFFDEFPYTTTSKVESVIKAHDYLKLDQVAQFMADMPSDATQTMKNYNKHIDAICGKQAVFYIVADKKDFEKRNSRRDPILLAQSPFGHVWQILGAWDKEMLFLEEL